MEMLADTGIWILRSVIYVTLMKCRLTMRGKKDAASLFPYQCHQ